MTPGGCRCPWGCPSCARLPVAPSQPRALSCGCWVLHSVPGTQHRTQLHPVLWSPSSVHSGTQQLLFISWVLIVFSFRRAPVCSGGLLYKSVRKCIPESDKAKGCACCEIWAWFTALLCSWKHFHWLQQAWIYSYFCENSEINEAALGHWEWRMAAVGRVLLLWCQ